MLLIWILWLAYAGLIIEVDHVLRVRRARARGQIDFDVGQPLRFLVLSLFASVLVLPVYFYMTYRRWWAMAVGLAATVAAVVATSVTLVAASLLLRR